MLKLLYCFLFILCLFYWGYGGIRFLQITNSADFKSEGNGLQADLNIAWIVSVVIHIIPLCVAFFFHCTIAMVAELFLTSIPFVFQIFKHQSFQKDYLITVGLILIEIALLWMMQSV